MMEDIFSLFPNAIAAPYPNGDEQFYWYKDNHNQYIGIHREDITDDQKKLLDIFLEPADFKVDRLNTHSVQQTWHHFLYLQDANKLEYLDQGTYRFIHYNLIGESMDISDFSEAIFTLLPDSTIVWKNHSSGVIIEDITSSMLTKNDFSDVINTLESDLYTHLRLFIGNHHLLSADTPALFLTEEACFNAVRAINSKIKVTTISSAFIEMLLSGQYQSLCFTLGEHLLNKLKDEEDLIKTVMVYIEANANATVAAKQLFLHRNSLNYRLDKFAELTNIDIRSFEEGLSAYLAIRLLEWHQKD